MAVQSICSGCGVMKSIYVTVTAILTTLGGRKDRRQKTTPTTRWCRTCFDSKKMPIQHLAALRETAKAVVSEKRAAEWDKTD